MPSNYVAGPSVNPNIIGSPTQYLQNIQNLTKSRRNSAIAEERTANDKIFQDAKIAMDERRQDYTEAAPERAEELRLANLQRDVDKSQTVANYAKGAQYSGGDRFTTLEADLMKDPRYANLDDAGKLAARNKYILDNPNALTDPSTFAETLKTGLIASGKFSGAEIDAAVAKEVQSRWPTADKEMLKSMLLKPKDLVPSASTNNSLVFGGNGGGVRRSGDSYSFVADPTNPTERGTVLDRVTDTFKLKDTPSTVPITGQRLDFGNMDASKADVAEAIGFLSENGVNSPTAQEAGFFQAFNADGTIKDGFDLRTVKGRQKLLEVARKTQDTEERVISKKGGDISTGGPGTNAAGGAIFSMPNAVKAAGDHNAAILAQLTPRAASDGRIVETFLNSLGQAPAQQAPAQTQPGKATTNQGGGSVPSPAVDPVAQAAAAQVAAESQAQDDAIFAHITGGKPGTVVQDAGNVGTEFAVGGPAVSDQIFSGAMSSIQDLLGQTPTGQIFNLAKDVVGGAQQIGQDLAPAAGGPILGSTKAAPQAPAVETAVKSLKGAERTQAVSAARQLAAQGKISIADADGQGDSREEALLIAYLKYVEGQR